MIEGSGRGGEREGEREREREKEREREREDSTLRVQLARPVAAAWTSPWLCIIL